MSKFIAVEANIGAGKSTMIPKLADWLTVKTGEAWSTVPEPTDDPEFHRLLKKFYEEPTTENRINFQMWITDTRAATCIALPEGNYVIERSLFSDLIFSHVNFLATEVPEGEYMKYFYHIKKRLTEYPKIDCCVYLKTTPQVAHERMKSRGRDGEEGISIDYLADVHMFHEACLPQIVREYPTPLVAFDWNSFGNCEEVADVVLETISE